MNAAPDMIVAGLKMIASLGVVLALILLLLYGTRRLTARRMGTSGRKRIQIIESHYMGLKKTISLVRVPGKVLVLGIAGDRINLLDTLDEATIDEATPERHAEPFGTLLSDRLKQIGKGFRGKDDR